jgi:hypothetical protein
MTRRGFLARLGGALTARSPRNDHRDGHQIDDRREREHQHRQADADHGGSCASCAAAAAAARS